MNNTLTELQAALTAAGHGADEVRDSPVDALNVWLDDEGRVPAATVTYESGRLVWGHRWEHSIEAAAGTDAAAAAIIESVR